MAIFANFLVSIPHRHAKNKAKASPKGLGLGVSIPHRHAKNRDKLLNELTEALFQFLIGTLET